MFGMRKAMRARKNRRKKKLRQRAMAAEDGTAQAYGSALDLNKRERRGRGRWMKRRLSDG